MDYQAYIRLALIILGGVHAIFWIRAIAVYIIDGNASLINIGILVGVLLAGIILLWVIWWGTEKILGDKKNKRFH